MGSLGADTDISNIVYNNIYTYGSNQMYMIKSNGGSGTVSNCQFNNFIGHSNAYSLNINAAWLQASKASGNGVIYENLSFNNWKGTAASATARGPINLLCSSTAPCTNITITDFNMGSEAGTTGKYVCQNAYGSGGCLKADGSHSAYTTTQSLASLPTATAAAKMGENLATPYALSVSIPIPAIPTSFFPGRTPVSALLGKIGAASHVAIAVSPSSKAAETTPTAVASTPDVAATTTAKASISQAAASKTTLATFTKPAATTAASSSGTVPLTW